MDRADSDALRVRVPHPVWTGQMLSPSPLGPARCSPPAAPLTFHNRVKTEGTLFGGACEACVGLLTEADVFVRDGDKASKKKAPAKGGDGTPLVDEDGVALTRAYCLWV